MRRRPSPVALALVALMIVIPSWRAARADSAAPSPRRHRVAATTWLAVGEQETIGAELSGAHRVVACATPLWITYGGALAHRGFACDSGDSCDSKERQLYAGAGFLRCTDAARSSGLCGGAALTLAWRHYQEWSEMPDPPVDDLAPQLRLYAEAGGPVRIRLGVRVELARAAADLGIVVAW